MKNQFDFFDFVEVKHNEDSNLQTLSGQRGSVLGMAQHEETKCWRYSVSLEFGGEVWDIPEELLTPTGELKQRSDFYSGESVKIKVNPNTGEGSVEE